MKSKIEIDQEFELKNDSDFGWQMLTYFHTAVLIGFIIASFLIMGVLTFVDWIKG